MTDAVYADDFVLLTNMPAQAKSLLHSLEQAVRSIGLYMITDTTVSMILRERKCR